MSRPFLALAFLTLVACGGDDETQDSGTGTTTGEISYQDMDFAQRQAYMAEVVMPAMQAEFAAYDSSRFSEITCATCHGDGASDGSFSMPSSSLYPIDVANFPTGAGADFMTDVVTPMMVDLLDEEPFDMNDGSGFGCFGCHPPAR